MSSDAPDRDEGGAAPAPAAIAATEEPVQLKVSLVEDDRVPEGMLCMGTYRNDRLVARSVLSPEAWAQIQELGFFDQPLQVVLVARLAPPGLQCQLFAMVPIPDEDSPDEAEEPWAVSVPSSAYEASVEREPAGSDDPRIAPIPLGNIVRYSRDRVYPESLPLETADVLRKIIEGGASEVVDRALADLLGLDGDEERMG
ncbi:MAG TPA: hypothetical protein VFU40_09630 [Gemmatimonadales bacterium]|nr:hypothetical protein [Gemmatimonadales bacterium]